MWAFLPRDQGSAATPGDTTDSGHVHMCPSLWPELCLFSSPWTESAHPLLQGWKGSL